MKTFKQFFTEVLASDLKKGDKIKNTNDECEHVDSEGEVEDVVKLPEKGSKKVKNKNNIPGRLVKYKVTNSGKNYDKGDTLYKTGDQLKKR
jgi:hypothetical protein